MAKQKLVPMIPVHCPICNGEGKVMNATIGVKVKCHACLGRGFVEVHQFEVVPPPAINTPNSEIEKLKKEVEKLLAERLIPPAYPYTYTGTWSGGTGGDTLVPNGWAGSVGGSVTIPNNYSNWKDIVLLLQTL